MSSSDLTWIGKSGMEGPVILSFTKRCGTVNGESGGSGGIDGGDGVCTDAENTTYESLSSSAGPAT